MANPFTPSPPPSANDPSTAAPADPAAALPGFEDRVREFWEKNSKLILLLCAGVVLAIVVKGAVELMRASQERAVSESYAEASANKQLGGFAAAHDGHALAGAAHLHLADEAYKEGRFAEAITAYEQADAMLTTPPFPGRIQLGLAISRLQTGQTGPAETTLRALANDVSQLKAVRAEAAYHLAMLAADAGRMDEVTQLSDQIMTIDPTSSWSQRAFMLRAMRMQTPAPAVEAAPETPAIQFNPGQ